MVEVSSAAGGRGGGVLVVVSFIRGVGSVVCGAHYWVICVCVCSTLQYW